jgi:hypothetical protein
MDAGGAKEVSARTPAEARRRGGQTQAAQLSLEARQRGGRAGGRQAPESGRVQEMAERAAEANRAAAAEFRSKRRHQQGLTTP